MARTNAITRPVVKVAVVAAIVAMLWMVLRPNRGRTAVELGTLVHSEQAAGYNLLLITLDTTRPDHLGCYGHAEARTPTIDALAAGGVRFDRAVTSATTTLASHTVIFTGLYPLATGVHDNGLYQLGSEHVTLAEILHDAGYATSAFIAAYVLDKRFGLDQGFDDYDFQVEVDDPAGSASYEHQRRASGVSRSVGRWLEAHAKSDADEPFFLWAHFYDPHQPYDSPLMQTGGFDGDPYDAEIAFVDLHVRRILDKLDSLGLRERTLIVLVSDHGEGRGEHGEAAHGVFIYDSTARLALIFSNPVLFPNGGQVDDRLAGTVDIVPTVLDLLGMAIPEGLDGQSLLTPVADDRAIYLETYYPLNMRCTPLTGLRRRDDKLIIAPQPEYYDLAHDPGELKNLYDLETVQASALQDELNMLLQHEPLDMMSNAQRQMNDQERESLAALGYASAPISGQAGELCDPKDRVELIGALDEVTRLIFEKRYEEGLEIARTVMAEAPGWETPVLRVAECLMWLDRDRELAELLAEHCKKYATAEMLFYLARSQLTIKEYAECAKTLDAAAACDPKFGAVPALRGDLYVAQGRYADAVAEYERALDSDPHRVGNDIRDKLARTRQLLNGTGP